MANFKYKKSKWTRRMPLICKYGHKGMAKTNYRQLNKRKKLEK